LLSNRSISVTQINGTIPTQLGKLVLLKQL